MSTKKMLLPCMVLAGMALLLFAGCPLDQPEPNPNFVAPDMGSPDQIAASNATTYPANQEEAIELFKSAHSLIANTAYTAFPGTVTEATEAGSPIYEIRDFSAIFNQSNGDISYNANVSSVTRRLNQAVVDNPGLISGNWIEIMRYTENGSQEIQTLDTLDVTYGYPLARPYTFSGTFYEKFDFVNISNAILAAPASAAPDYYSHADLQFYFNVRYAVGAAMSIKDSTSGLGAKFILSHADNLNTEYLESRDGDFPYSPMNYSVATLKVYDDANNLLFDITKKLHELGIAFLY